MTDKKQIEEMARKMCRNYTPNGSCASDDDTCQLECAYGYCAERIYCAGYRKQEWISVDERLPEKDGRYLVAMKNGGNYHISTRRFKRTDPPIWWKGHSYGYWARHTGGVTHWMPLPEPPKGE
jgi:hypothetical protein